MLPLLLHVLLTDFRYTYVQVGVGVYFVLAASAANDIQKVRSRSGACLVPVALILHIHLLMVPWSAAELARQDSRQL